jgi:hypothetical protein
MSDIGSNLFQMDTAATPLNSPTSQDIKLDLSSLPAWYSENKTSKQRGRPRGSSKSRTEIPPGNPIIKFVDVPEASLSPAPLTKDKCYAFILYCSCGARYAAVSNTSPSQYIATLKFQAKKGKVSNPLLQHLKTYGGHEVLSKYSIVQEFNEKKSTATLHDVRNSIAIQYECINKPVMDLPLIDLELHDFDEKKTDLCSESSESKP